MADKKPQSTMGKDVLFIVVIFLVFLGAGAWLVLSFIQSWSESPKETKPETDSAEVTTGDSTRSTPQVSHEQKKKAGEEITLAFTLPRDAEKLKEETEYFLAGSAADNLYLVFSQPTKKLVIVVPAGSKVVPGENTDLAEFYVIKAARIEIGPLDYPAGRLETVRNSAVKHGLPEKSDRLEFAASDPEDRVYQFVVQAEKDGLNWGSVQSGVWMLMENISPEDFNLITVTVSTPGKSTYRRKSVAANYEELKKTSFTFRKIGWEYQSFRLLVQSEKTFHSILREMDFDNPGKNYRSQLANKTLLEYQVEPVVEKLLLRYLMEHPQPHIRLSALKNLLAMEVRATAGSLIATLQKESNRHVAFLAAYRLFLLGDERSLPLLTAFEKDPDLKTLFERKTAARIREVSRKSRKSNEDLLSFWTRTIGWDSLNYNTETVRQMLETLLEMPDPLLVEALQKASSTDFKEANTALNQLKKYPKNQDAFDALVKLASSHREGTIRFYATGALNRFDTFDLREFCQERLKRDPDHRVAQSAISLATRQKFPGFEEVILLGCKNRHPKVREWAAGAVGSLKISQGTAVLLNMAQRDSEKKVRQKALRSLSELKSYDVLALLKRLLKSPESRDKWTALNTIRLWKSNPDALDLLEPYRGNQVIGTSVSKYLANYGR